MTRKPILLLAGLSLVGLIVTIVWDKPVWTGVPTVLMFTFLALYVIQSDLAAIPPVIFGPWMNMSGASLASWWAGRPPKDGSRKVQS